MTNPKPTRPFARLDNALNLIAPFSVIFVVLLIACALLFNSAATETVRANANEDRANISESQYAVLVAERQGEVDGSDQASIVFYDETSTPVTERSSITVDDYLPSTTGDEYYAAYATAFTTVKRAYLVDLYADAFTAGQVQSNVITNLISDPTQVADFNASTGGSGPIAFESIDPFHLTAAQATDDIYVQAYVAGVNAERVAHVNHSVAVMVNPYN